MQLPSVILCVLIVVTIALAQVPQDFGQLLRAHTQCQSTARISPTAININELSSGNFPNDPAFKRHLLCINKALGIQDTNGNLQINAITRLATAMAPPGTNRNTIQEVVNRCAVQRRDEEETAYQTDSCLLQARRLYSGK
ncbi:unnamed protein product [Phyllotreta striolata]|uniref:Uncharacterized protein n=1 Tax=Phyllotreta striolata TaxID=444603 RepID=A0A9N9TJD6_PHYSR|nr:unnamed protein product [Phyllotreta striolata]